MGGQSSVRLVDAVGQMRYDALLEQVEHKESLGLIQAPELELEVMSMAQALSSMGLPSR